MRSMTSAIDSVTMYLAPSTMTSVVSGLAWMRSIRSGLIANWLSFSRVTTIISPSLALYFVHQASCLHNALSATASAALASAETPPLQENAERGSPFQARVQFVPRSEGRPALGGEFVY